MREGCNFTAPSRGGSGASWGAAPAAKGDTAPAEPWVEIMLPSSRRLGYVQKRWVRWVGAMRIGFAKRGGQWFVVRIETGR